MNLWSGCKLVRTSLSALQWFPEGARALALQGAEVTTLPHGCISIPISTGPATIEWVLLLVSSDDSNYHPSPT